MGLDDSYDHVKNQILVMDLLPSINKAYPWLQVLKNEVQVSLMDNAEDNGMIARSENFRNYGDGTGNIKKKANSKGMDCYCDHYGLDDHIKDICFKLHGYSDWYKNLKNKKSKNSSKFHANFADTPFGKDQDSMIDKNSKENNLSTFHI